MWGCSFKPYISLHETTLIYFLKQIIQTTNYVATHYIYILPFHRINLYRDA